jgi:NAD dependent epimerase/dehydratase family enzyme
MDGVMQLTSPNPIPNRDMTAALADLVGRSAA